VEKTPKKRIKGRCVKNSLIGRLNDAANTIGGNNIEKNTSLSNIGYYE
jgi:hypothetical protein